MAQIEKGKIFVAADAIDYADGVVAATADADPALIEYARAKGKPVMDFPGDENYADAYINFYNTLPE